MASKLLRVSKKFSTISQRFASSHHHADYIAALSNHPPTELSATENNIRVASQDFSNSEITTVGLFLESGSRYEVASKNGVGNFLQRVIISGDPKADAEIKKMGARLYAYNNQEQTAVYATCLTQDVPKIVEILSDMVQNPKLTDENIEKVRKQLLDEPEDILNNIQQFVMEYLHSIAYQGTPLSQSPIGKREVIKSLTAKDLEYFLNSNYKASRTVLAAAGGVKHNELVDLARKHLSGLDDAFDGSPVTLSPCRFTGSDFRFRDDSIDFAHFALAVQGPGFNSPDRLPIAIANEVIGTYDRSLGKTADDDSYDLAHIVDQFNITYSDTGLFGAYIACEIMQADEMAFTLMNAWKNICFTITDAQLNNAKKRLIRKILSQQSGTKGNCEAIGRSVCELNRHNTLYELISSIENCHNEHIRETTEKYIQNQTLAVSGIGALCNLSDYVNLQIQMRLRRI